MYVIGKNKKSFPRNIRYTRVDTGCIGERTTLGSDYTEHGSGSTVYLVERRGYFRRYALSQQNKTEAKMEIKVFILNLKENNRKYFVERLSCIVSKLISTVSWLACTIIGRIHLVTQQKCTRSTLK